MHDEDFFDPLNISCLKNAFVKLSIRGVKILRKCHPKVIFRILKEL